MDPPGGAASAEQDVAAGDLGAWEGEEGGGGVAGTGVWGKR